MPRPAPFRGPGNLLTQGLAQNQPSNVVTGILAAGELVATPAAGSRVVVRRLWVVSTGTLAATPSGLYLRREGVAGARILAASVTADGRWFDWQGYLPLPAAQSLNRDSFGFGGADEWFYGIEWDVETIAG